MLFRRASKLTGLFILILLSFNSSNGQTKEANKSLFSKSQLQANECFKIIQDDSVVFYFDKYYKLTQADCAAILRYTRVNSKFVYQGLFSDYYTATGHLIARGVYNNQIRDGLFEEYYPETGQLLSRGRYRQGVPVGEWEYWYENGKPEQVLRYEADGLKLWQMWNEEGQQVLKNGNGIWYSAGPTWRGGPVKNGLPDGRWEDRKWPYSIKETSFDTTHTAKRKKTVSSKNVFSYEEFEHGRMQKGVWVVKFPGVVSPYFGESHLLPGLPVGAYQSAEKLRMGSTCAESNTIHSLVLTPKVPPIWPAGIDKFRETVEESVKEKFHLLSKSIEMVKLTMEIDSQGHAGSVHVEPMAARNTAVWLGSLKKTWTPARIGDKAVKGKIVLIVKRMYPENEEVAPFFQISIATLCGAE